MTIRRIANQTDEKLDKQALKTLNDKGFIKPFRKTKWRLTGKGEMAIKYHHKRDARINSAKKKGWAKINAYKKRMG